MSKMTDTVEMTGWDTRVKVEITANSERDQMAMHVMQDIRDAVEDVVGELDLEEPPGYIESNQGGNQ